MVRKSKVSSSFSMSRLADSYVEKMVEDKVFANRSNAVESSILLMHFITHANTIIPAAAQLGITPLTNGVKM